MGTFTIGRKPARIYSRGLGSGCIANLDLTNTLYFGTDDGLSTASDTIPPLGAIVVDGSSTLFASTQSAAQIQVQATPGASSWTPSPAQVAAQISALGLATATNQTGAGALATAAAIATGSVTGTAGGVPLLGAPALLYNYSFTAAANTGSQNVLTGAAGASIVSMGTYLSYDFSANVTCNVAETSPFMLWTFNWYLDPAATYLAYSEQWCMPVTTTGNLLFGNGPVRAEFLRIQVSTLGSLDTMTINPVMLSGSSRVYSGDAPDLRTSTVTTPPGYASMTLGHNIGDNVLGGVTGASGNIAASSTTLYVCGLYNGDININLLPVGTLSGVTYTPMSYLPGIGLMQVAASSSLTVAASSALTQTLRYPFILQFVSSNGSAQSLNFNVLAGSRF